jgi:hypothetical protein
LPAGTEPTISDTRSPGWRRSLAGSAWILRQERIEPLPRKDFKSCLFRHPGAERLRLL